jgi:urease accessory protein
MNDASLCELAAIDARAGPAATAGLQRAHGRLKVGFRRAGHGETRVSVLYEQGCLKARLPRSRCPGEAELVMLNTAGGLTGGDHLSIDVSVAADARTTVTTPGCERIYRSLQGDAVIEQRRHVGHAARLDWIPQETILYQRGRVRRRIDVELEPDAEITLIEGLILGRAAMGEVVTNACFSDFWQVRRGARLVFADGTRIDGAFGQVVANPATLDGNASMACLMHVGRDLPAKRDALRERFEQVVDAHAGASIVGEILVGRIVAAGGAALRRGLVAALAILREARPLPRLWSC